MADEYIAPRDIQSSGLMAHQGMKIMADSAVVWKMIAADYSRAWACIPEYIQNAIDEDPATCEIRWPSLLDPAFHIIDNGRGISHEFMMEEFCTVGYSTKSSAFLGSTEEANKKVGGKGIGRLSGPDGTIFKCRDPVEIRTYVMTKDHQYRPSISMVSRKPNPGNVPAGVTVRVPVNPREINSAITDAKNLLRFFPIAKVPKDFDRPQYVMETPNWGVLQRTATWGNENTIVVCGGYPYEVEFSKLPAKYTGYSAPTRDLLQTVYEGNHAAFVLHIPVGSLDISMNRENLNLTDRTMTALINAARTMLDEYIPHLTSEVGKAPNLWEARKIYSKLYETLSSRLVREINKRKVKWGQHVLEGQHYEFKQQVYWVDTTYRRRGGAYGVMPKKIVLEPTEGFKLNPNQSALRVVIRDIDQFVPSRILANASYGEKILLLTKEDPNLDGLKYEKLSDWALPERVKGVAAARTKIKMKKWRHGDWKEHEDVFGPGTIYVQLFGRDIKDDPAIKQWDVIRDYAVEHNTNFIGVPQTLAHKVQPDWIKLTDHLARMLQPHMQRLANAHYIGTNVESDDSNKMSFLRKLARDQIPNAVEALLVAARKDSELLNLALEGLGLTLPKPTIDISVMTKDLRKLFGPKTLLGVLSKCSTYSLDEEDWKVIGKSI